MTSHDQTRKQQCVYFITLSYRASPMAKCIIAQGHMPIGTFLTLLFQKEGQSGLDICPGREVVTEFGIGDECTKVEAITGEIVCNIGDILMSWSDDRFTSTFHRVKTPYEPNDYFGDRYSIAYFNHPCKDILIQGLLKKYPLVTGAQFTESAVKWNFAALQES